MVLVKVGFEMDMRNVYSSSWVNYLALAILPLEGRFVGGGNYLQMTFLQHSGLPYLTGLISAWHMVLENCFSEAKKK